MNPTENTTKSSGAECVSNFDTKPAEDIGDYNIGWSSDQQSLENQPVIQIIYGFIATLGIVGNFMVIFTVARVPALRTLTYAFIVSLATCDVITSVFVIPLHLGGGITYIPQGVAGDVMCGMLLSKWPLWSSFTASVFSLTCVTLERYYNICRPLHYSTIFTKKKVAALIVAVWLAGFTMSSYMLYVIRFNGIGCIIDWYYVEFQIFVGICYFSIVFAVPIIIMGICYMTIMKNLSNSAASLSHSAGKESQASLDLLRARKNVIKMLAIVVITFVICWSPNQFLFLSYNLGFKLDFTTWYYHVSVLIACCNSCMNPLIYAFKSRNYRKAMRIAILGHRSVSSVSDIDLND